MIFADVGDLVADDTLAVVKMISLTPGDGLEVGRGVLVIKVQFFIVAQMNATFLPRLIGRYLFFLGFECLFPRLLAAKFKIFFDFVDSLKIR